jgi:hypothetical protein
VVIAAGVGVVTNIATDQAAWGWWTALTVLVALGAGLQLYLNAVSPPGDDRAVRAQGAGSVAVGGSTQGPISTQATGYSSNSGQRDLQQSGTVAAGPGAVAIGGDAGDSINTNVSED